MAEENKNQASHAEFFGLDKMKPCICGRGQLSVYVCTDKNCINHDSLRLYCNPCFEDDKHDHPGQKKPVRIIKEVQESGIKWLQIKNDMATLQLDSARALDPFKSLIDMCERLMKPSTMNNHHVNFKSLSKDLSNLTEKNSHLQLLYTQTVQELVAQCDILKLYEHDHHLVETRQVIQSLSYLREVDEDHIWRAYMPALQSAILDETQQGDIDDASKVILQRMRFKWMNQRLEILEQRNSANSTSMLERDFQQQMSLGEDASDVNRRVTNVEGRINECAQAFWGMQQELPKISRVIEEQKSEFGSSLEDQKRVIDSQRNEISQLKSQLEQQKSQVHNQSMQVEELKANNASLRQEIQASEERLQTNITSQRDLQNSFKALIEQELAKFKKDALLGFKQEEFIEGENWTCLFGVNKTSKFGYDNSFWTEKAPLNLFINPEKFTSNFKFPSFYEKPISQIMIVSECGQKTVLQLPTNQKPLMEYFIENQCVNIGCISGAPDPGKLILNVDGIPFLGPSIWRINSRTTTQYYNQNRAAIRLGGMFSITWAQYTNDHGDDTNNNRCSPEKAGFGITDECWAPFDNRSFGTRMAFNLQGEGLTAGKGSYATGAVVYGR